MQIVKNITSINRTPNGNKDRVKYIVIHYLGALGSAKRACNNFVKNAQPASAHYFVDSGSIIYQCVEDFDIAWHCGTKGTYFHPECRNANSIGIEVCPKKLNAARAKIASDTDWYFEDATEENLVDLVRYLMEKYDVPVDRVLRHYDVTHKLCPRPFVGDDRNIVYAKTGNAMWENFKNRLKEDNMDFSTLTDEQVDALLNRIDKRTESLSLSEYAKEASQKAVQKAAMSDGNNDGHIDNPKGYLKRQELAVILDRLKLLD